MFLIIHSLKIIHKNCNTTPISSSVYVVFVCEYTFKVLSLFVSSGHSVLNPVPVPNLSDLKITIYMEPVITGTETRSKELK